MSVFLNERAGDAALELSGNAREEAIALEERLLSAIYAADKATMRKMMAPDGIGVDRAFGFATQASLIEGIHGVQASSWEIIEPRVLAVGESGRIVAYRLLQRAAFQGKLEPPDVYSTTVWAKTQGRWMAIFHQETPALNH